MTDKTITQLTAAAAMTGADLLVCTQGGNSRKATVAQVRAALGLGGKLVLVGAASDFPAAVSGVRTLAAETTYFLTGNVDLAGDRLVGGVDSCIIGGSSENCVLSSTGLTGAALITSAYSLPLRSIGITAETALALNATGTPTAALDWFGVNFIDCPTVGTIANYNNFIAADCGFLNCGALTFDGTIGTVGFSQCIFDAAATKTSIVLPATLVVTRRFRVIYSAFITLAGEIAINASASATIPVQGYILDTVNFSGGGTYMLGVQYDDNKAQVLNSTNVANSASLAYYTMNGNAVATTIGTPGVAEKAAGATVSQGVTQKFSHSNNRATYTGALSRAFKVSATLSCSSGNNNQIGVYIAKSNSPIAHSESYITANGAGRAEQAKVQAVVELSTGDYIEVFVENATAANDITVSDLSVIVEALG